MPDIINVNENKYEIKPKDCRNKSETKLPLNPKIFFISVLSGNIKFGSPGEYESKEINNKKPEIKTINPKVSATLLIVKLSSKFAVFLKSINVNQLYHFVSSNFCC